MHSPPAFQVSIVHFGVWRALCAGMAAAAVLTAVMWAATMAGHSAWVWLWPLAVSAGCAMLLRRPMPFRLRWDTQDWFVEPGEGRALAGPGALQVALDLGGWMLLRFAPVAGGPARWLPVQCRGHEPAWHGLRSTVYCARSPVDRAVADL